MVKQLAVIILVLTMGSCNSRKNKVDTTTDIQIQNKTINEDSIKQVELRIKDSIRLVAQRIEDSIQLDKKRTEDSIIKMENILLDSALLKSVHGLSLVQNIWKSDTVCVFEKTENITTLRNFTDTSLIVITFKRAIYNEYHFYEIGINGKILHDTLLPYCNNPDISDVNNFTVTELGNVLYKLEYKSDKTYYYNAKTKTHNVINQEIEQNKYKSSYTEPEFRSHDGHYSIIIDLHVLKLKNNETGVLYELISRNESLYSLNWCFGLGSWNNDNTKFYFDNSGEVACIWEINLDKQSLEKIVPEHEAMSPVCVGNTVFYLENHTIKKTDYIENGVVLKQGLGIQDARLVDLEVYD